MMMNGYLSFIASLALAVKAYQVPATYPNISSCALQTPTFSCENTTVIANTCCSPTPGGLVLVTQFWSRYTGLEKQGQLLPKGSWTIHGLWPDNCDGWVNCILLYRVCGLTSPILDRSSSTAISRANMTRIPRRRRCLTELSYRRTKGLV